MKAKNLKILVESELGKATSLKRFRYDYSRKGALNIIYRDKFESCGHEKY